MINHFLREPWLGQALALTCLSHLATTLGFGDLRFLFNLPNYPTCSDLINFSLANLSFSPLK